MKKILATLLAAAALAGCYDEYVKDYDYSGVYIAYQYDLRTFVVGEGMKFTVGSVLAGVMDNERDRSVYYALDDELVTGDLAPFNGLDELGQPSAPFTAFDVMSGKSTSGTVSQSYVTAAVKASGIKKLTPLPREYFTVSNDEKMTIRRGRHTGTITVQADSAAFLADAQASRNPYYAVGFRITSADADTILLSKSFEVIAVRYENKLFGNYYHGGVTQVVNAQGEELSKEVYPTAVPSDEGTHGIYTLTTDAPDALTTNYIGTKEGSVRLTLDGKEIRVSGSVDGSKEIEDLGSGFNGARLLQNRKLYLHYRYPNGDGTVTCGAGCGTERPFRRPYRPAASSTLSVRVSCGRSGRGTQGRRCGCSSPTGRPQGRRIRIPGGAHNVRSASGQRNPASRRRSRRATSLSG